MFSLGQIFTDSYPPEAAEWCNASQLAFMNEIEQDEEGRRRFRIDPVPQPALQERKKHRLELVNAAYENAVSALVNTYPPTELLTFDKQEAEARAYLDDASASTPFLSGLAAARGITLDDLVRRVIAKSDAFAVVVASLTGQRQRYEDLLDAAVTVEDLEAVVPEYTLPDGEA